MFFFNFDDFQIIGSSPEILVRLRKNKITIRPIAGTRPRGKNSARDKFYKNNKYVIFDIPETLLVCYAFLRENLNKKEIAVARLDELKNGDLKIEMRHLNIINSPNGFLQNLEEIKKKMGINNFWKEEQYKKWREDIKKHPENVIRMT